MADLDLRLTMTDATVHALLRPGARCLEGDAIGKKTINQTSFVHVLAGLTAHRLAAFLALRLSSSGEGKRSILDTAL